MFIYKLVMVIFYPKTEADPPHPHSLCEYCMAIIVSLELRFVAGIYCSATPYLSFSMAIIAPLLTWGLGFGGRGWLWFATLTKRKG